MFSNVYQGKRVFITGHDPDEIERVSPSESPIPYNWSLVSR